MAYQPKSYKKFVATAATATLVATAVAPTALAADFTDVNANYKNAVDYLVDQGIANGLTETTFGVTSPIKRGDAAIMIAKALGLNTTTAPDAGFTDVNARVAGAVNAIVEAGIASGKTSTTFAPDLYITRQETAKMIANAYGLTGSGTTKFADVNSNWAPFVSALEQAGIAQGLNETTFGATNDVTRGQFALFLYRAEGQPYEVATVESLMFNAEGNEFTLKFAEALPEDADLAYVLENYTVLVNGSAPSAATVEALKLAIKNVSADRKTVVVSHTDLDDLASALGGTQVTLSIGGKSDTHVFDTNVKVSSAEVLNATQVKVNFSEAVDETSAELATNYSVNGAALGGTPVLSADGRSVVITFAASKNNTSFTLDVANVRSVDLKETIEDFRATLTVVDTAAPTVTRSALASNGNLEITFSEPLGATTPIVRVNGQPVEVTPFSAGVTKIVIDKDEFSVANGATATVYVAGAKDTVGNEMAIFNGTFTRTDDQVKPVISSVTQQGENQLKVVFSEALGSNVLNDNELRLLRGATVYNSTAALDTNDSSERTYIVTFNANEIYSSSTTNSSSVSLLLAASAVNDGAGNNNDAWSQTFTFNRDKTAPTLVSSKVAADKQTFELKFSEAIDATVNAGSIVVTDSKGVRFPVATATRTAADTVTVDLFASAAAMANDTYTVQLQNGAVKDVVGNNLAATTTQLIVGSSSDTSRPTVALDVDGLSTLPVGDEPISGVNVFVLDFSEEVTTATALNRANYRLDGAALPSNATIYFNSTDRNSVTIELPANSVNIGNATNGTAAILNVSGVQDLAGNTVNSTNLNVLIGDNTPALLTSAQKVGNSVVVTFSEALMVTDLDPTDFVLLDANGSTVGNIDTVTAVSGNARQAQINFTSTGVPTVSYTVETAPTGTLSLRDANGLSVKPEVSVTAN